MHARALDDMILTRQSTQWLAIIALVLLATRGTFRANIGTGFSGSSSNGSSSSDSAAKPMFLGEQQRDFQRSYESCDADFGLAYMRRWMEAQVNLGPAPPSTPPLQHRGMAAAKAAPSAPSGSSVTCWDNPSSLMVACLSRNLVYRPTAHPQQPRQKHQQQKQQEEELVGLSCSSSPRPLTGSSTISTSNKNTTSSNYSSSSGSSSSHEGSPRSTSNTVFSNTNSCSSARGREQATAPISRASNLTLAGVLGPLPAAAKEHLATWLGPSRVTALPAKTVESLCSIKSAISQPVLLIHRLDTINTFHAFE